MSRQDFFNGFVFDNQAAIDPDVQAKRLFKDEAFIFKGHCDLIDRTDALQLEFMEQP